MTDRTGLALAATRRLRASAAFRGLSSAEQARLGGDLDRIERALGATPPAARYGDPYALTQATPADFDRERSLGPGGYPGAYPGSAPARQPAAPAPAAPAAPPRPN